MNAQKVWAEWIVKIANDPQMDKDRLLRHLQLHINSHMPNADANKERWLRWIAGTYNLLGVLVGMTTAEPTFEHGVSRLFRHWETACFDHTPPPKGKIEICRSMSKVFK